MEEKIIVPSGMFQAALTAAKQCQLERMDVPKSAQFITEAALRHLSEHPIEPTDEQIAAIRQTWRDMPNPLIEDYNYTRFVITEFQRRMFLAPEPEVPEEEFSVDIDAVQDILRLNYDNAKRLIGAMRGKAAR